MYDKSMSFVSKVPSRMLKLASVNNTIVNTQFGVVSKQQSRPPNASLFQSAESKSTSSRTPPTEFPPTTDNPKPFPPTLSEHIKVISNYGFATAGALIRQSPGHFPDFGSPLKL
jgi:hypothetical protein